MRWIGWTYDGFGRHGAVVDGVDELESLRRLSREGEERAQRYLTARARRSGSEDLVNDGHGYVAQTSCVVRVHAWKS